MHTILKLTKRVGIGYVDFKYCTDTWDQDLGENTEFEHDFDFGRKRFCNFLYGAHIDNFLFFSISVRTAKTGSGYLQLIDLKPSQCVSLKNLSCRAFLSKASRLLSHSVLKKITVKLKHYIHSLSSDTHRSGPGRTPVAD